MCYSDGNHHCNTYLALGSYLSRIFANNVATKSKICVTV